MRILSLAGRALNVACAKRIGGGDIGASARNGVGIQRLHRIAKGIVIGRNRSLQKGIAREGNQTDAIAMQVVEQILRGQLRAGEPVRLHVRSQHALGRVDRDQDIEPAAMRTSVVYRALRSRQRHAEQAMAAIIATRLIHSRRSDTELCELRDQA